MRYCVFCGERSNSKEHAWPAWLLKRGRPGRAIKWLRGLDAQSVIAIPSGELKVGAVCETCNNGWMDRIERDALVMGLMHDDMSVSLGEDLQKAVAVWAVKTAMVLEAFGKKNHPWFYEPRDRHEMRLARVIPARTEVWVGRYLGLETPSSYGGPFGPNDQVTYGFAMTMTFGALALHLVTLRSDYRVPAAEGWWLDALLRVWPATPGVIRWPPRRHFTEESGHLPLSALVNRVTTVRRLHRATQAGE